MTQITARLSPTSRRRFEVYAKSLGLNGSSLARVLLLRALGLRMPSDEKQDSQDGKLTAHGCTDDVVQRLKAHAKTRRVTKAKAVKDIFERELKDCWLAHAMGLSQQSRQPRKR
jgi:hypothetical protein